MNFHSQNTSTNTAKTCCPVHPTKMGKIKTLEANPDGTGPQIWEDASSSTYVTRQAGTQFSVRSSNFRTIKHWSQSDEFCAGSLRTSPKVPPIPYMGPPERVLLDLCSQLLVLNRSQREHLRYLRISTSDTTNYWKNELEFNSFTGSFPLEKSMQDSFRLGHYFNVPFWCHFYCAISNVPYWTLAHRC